MTIETNFLNCAAETLAELCPRIETCLGKLTADQVWMRGTENQNAVGNLVLHLNGNVRQWILAGVGGQALAIIRSLPPERLAEEVVIQGYHGTVLKAIFHVVEHFSGHTAQIIFITKMLTGADLGFYSYLSGSPHSNAGKTA
jgi:hypothetical protein